MRVVTFKMDDYLLEKLDRIARRTGKSRSELLREGVELVIEKYDRSLFGKSTVEAIRIG
ncbi:MAG: ribbon-helix-helix domain-containing protein [Desulfurococcales archaeon]|nr:ribbon-helix-helix domain-containing protein [Desulfurococcales archaeon]